MTTMHIQHHFEALGKDEDAESMMLAGLLPGKSDLTTITSFLCHLDLFGKCGCRIIDVSSSNEIRVPGMKSVIFDVQVLAKHTGRYSNLEKVV